MTGANLQWENAPTEPREELPGGGERGPGKQPGQSDVKTVHLQDAVLICPGRPQPGAREQKARLLWVDSWTQQPDMKSLFL